jgi:hypothetical protein
MAKIFEKLKNLKSYKGAVRSYGLDDHGWTAGKGNR